MAASVWEGYMQALCRGRCEHWQCTRWYNPRPPLMVHVYRRARWWRRMPAAPVRGSAAQLRAAGYEPVPRPKPAKNSSN